MAANPTPAKPGATSKKRENPVERQMSRADSLSSMQEFGAIVPPSKQGALREQKKGKPKGPLNRMWSSLTSALGGK